MRHGLAEHVVHAWGMDPPSALHMHAAPCSGTGTRAVLQACLLQYAAATACMHAGHVDALRRPGSSWMLPEGCIGVARKIRTQGLCDDILRSVLSRA
jgi:hypothetical protein